MNPISAVASVESVIQAATKAIATPATEALGQKFDTLMKTQQPGMSPQAHDAALPPNEGVTTLTSAMSHQEAALRELTTDAQELVQRSPHMNMSEMMAHTIDISHRMTIVNVKMTATTSLGSNSNKSLQSLLKNQ